MSDCHLAKICVAPTHEKVVGVRIGPSNFEQLHEIVELTVNVSTYSDWAFLDDSVSCFVLATFHGRLTTGCTLDSSCKISRACVDLVNKWILRIESAPLSSE